MVFFYFTLIKFLSVIIILVPRIVGINATKIGMFDKHLILQKYMLNNVYRPGQPPTVDLSPNTLVTKDNEDSNSTVEAFEDWRRLRLTKRPRAIMLKVKQYLHYYY